MKIYTAILIFVFFISVVSAESHKQSSFEGDKKSKITGVAGYINSVAVPGDFPRIKIDVHEQTAEGKIFVSSYYDILYLMILENDGTPYFYQRIPLYSTDFKLQPTGTLTRNVSLQVGYIEMDSQYNIIDTLKCGNGYYTDIHDLQLLPNGNYLVIARDDRRIDMSKIVAGGSRSATVRGNHVQEMDRSGNVIFECRSWDIFEITDAIGVDLTANSIDYVHMNALAVDYDNNILISSRNLSEVTKINRQSGEIIWRLGGKNNQFEFVNDEYGISYQHDIRPVPDKENHYTLFDNGNHHSPQFSRAVEFQIDTVNMTATKIWEYRHTPDRFAPNRGNVQRLPNGNTLINWAQGDLPKVTEVTPEGEVVYEMNFDANGEEGLISYRSFRFDWEGIAAVPYLVAEPHTDKVTLIYNKFGDDKAVEYRIYGGQNPNPTQLITTTGDKIFHLTDLENYQTYYFRVTAVDKNGIESDYSNEESVFVKFIEPGDNLVLNGDFSLGEQFWDLVLSEDAEAIGIVMGDFYQVLIDSAGDYSTDILFRQSNLEIVEERQYILDFDAWSSEPKIFYVRVRKSSDPYTDYSKIGAVFSTAERSHFRYEFFMEDPSDYSAELVFECGQSTSDLFIDNVSLRYVTETSIEPAIESPLRFNLEANYPNPFNPSTIINYELRITSDVDLSVYNLLGQKVAILVSEKQAAGRYQVEWNASDFASGVYYYKIQAGEFVDVRKMVLIR
jgi:hypothetical protein